MGRDRVVRRLRPGGLVHRPGDPQPGLADPAAVTSVTGPLPSDALCERCWTPVLSGQGAVRFGHITGSTLHGDVQWAFTYLHVYDPNEGCVRGTTSVWD